MKIYLIKWDYDNGLTYEDYRTGVMYYMYSTLCLAEKAYYAFIYYEYEGKYTLIEKTLDTQEEKILEESPWRNCSPECPYYPWEDEDIDYDAQAYDPFYNKGLAYSELYNSYYQDEYLAPSSEEQWKEHELEELNKQLTNIILDDNAKDFCGEYNECRGISILEEAIIAKYNKRFEALGYPNAWKEYLTEILH